MSQREAAVAAERATEASIEVRNPATDEVIAHVAKSSARMVREAIDSAAASVTGWSGIPGVERARHLRQLSELLIRDQERLARLITCEQGKPLAEARAEVTYAAGFVEWSAEEAKRIYGEIVPAFTSANRILVLRQPIGVTAAITPWNFPAAMITRKLGPALAAGCPMIVRPSSATPLTALAIRDLALEAGIPHGAVQVVNGDAEIVSDALLDDPRVRALSFTGSTHVGKRLMANAARHVTKVELELGGHAPFIVFDDADIDAAVVGAIASKFRNAGQTCVCANRIFVQSGIYEEFAERLSDAAASLRVGNGLDDGVQIGPLVNDAAVTKVEEHVADALRLGAHVRVGGHRVALASGLADRFYAPTVIENVGSPMRMYREETFGPVAPLTRFDTEDSVISEANASEYGLAAYFYTRDASRLIRVAERLEYGIVGANDAMPSTPQAPFGGMKESGLGREGGKWGLDLFLETKYVSVGLG